MADPDWLKRARAKGLVVSEGGAAGPPRPPGRPPEVRTGGGYAAAVELAVPVRVISEANRRDHWAAAARRGGAQAAALTEALAATGLGGWRVRTPAAVTLTHVGPVMDGDNLQRAFKALRDKLAEWIGVDDGDPRVTWAYRQEAGPPGVRVRVECRV